MKSTFLDKGDAVREGHDGGHDLGRDLGGIHSKKGRGRKNGREVPADAENPDKVEAGLVRPLVVYQAGEAGKTRRDVGEKFDHKARYDGDGVVTEEDQHKFFTLGLLRKPCDFLLSVYGQHNDYKPTRVSDKPHFREWVSERLNASQHLAAFDDMQRVLDTAILSDRVRARYGISAAFPRGHVHCMSRMHKMKEDFGQCVHKYKACGGYVNPNNTASDFLDGALEDSAHHAKSGGRSVGDHATCDDMFDDDLKALVMKREGGLVSRFHLGTCC